MWIIGVDGGGTKCEAGLFNPAGQLVATAFSGPANVFANFEGAMQSIERACKQLLYAWNSQEHQSLINSSTKTMLRPSDCFLSLGCAGGGIDLAKKNFQRWRHEYAGAILHTDVHVSCLAANNNKPCALFVIGTGSCLAVYQNNKVKQLGGHGFLLGDIASGAWLGKKALSWYLQALETPNTDSELQTTLASVLGNNVSKIIEQYGQAESGAFGALAPTILEAKEASPNVRSWLFEGAQYACELIVKHTQKGMPIFVVGGLASVYKPLIEELISATIQVPNNNAVYGAFYAGKQHLLTSRA